VAVTQPGGHPAGGDRGDDAERQRRQQRDRIVGGQILTVAFREQR
jgi:hypothetical protein